MGGGGGPAHQGGVPGVFRVCSGFSRWSVARAFVPVHLKTESFRS